MERINKDKKPIFYDNAEEMDKPLSELMEGLRSEVNNTRGKMRDIIRLYGWESRIEPLEGGLTCMLMAMHVIMQEFKDYENQQRIKVEKV